MMMMMMNMLMLMLMPIIIVLVMVIAMDKTLIRTMIIILMRRMERMEDG